MKFALAQIDVIPNRPDQNIRTMVQKIREAKAQGVDLIAFPEMAVGGYLLGDKWLDDSFCQDLMTFNDIILQESTGIGVIYGNIYYIDPNQSSDPSEHHPNQDGRARKYNAVYFYQNGKAVKRLMPCICLPHGVQPKLLLPNYRFFDDRRYFFSLHDVAIDYGIKLEDLVQPFVFEKEGRKVHIGLSICEDLWCYDYKRNLKPLSITDLLIQNGADYIFNISASPWTFGKNGARDRRIQYLKEESHKNFKPYFYVNCIGAQNNGKNIVTFDGDSTIYNEDALPVLKCTDPYTEALLVYDTTTQPPTLSYPDKGSKIEQKYQAIIHGIRHMKNIFGSGSHPKYIIGLSGGIDSALVAALLSQAVGPNNILAANMPSRYNSQKTRDSAKDVSKKLGIPYLEVPIDDLVQSTIDTIENHDNHDPEKRLSVLNIENIQAKIRGTSVLSNLSGKHGAIFTNNGNKIEIALGYATLYGDVGGAIAPIGDLTKEEVFEMADYLNRHVFSTPVIPEALIPDRLFRFRQDQIVPSAELKENQVDPIKFGYHCRMIEKMTEYTKKSIEDILSAYLDGNLESLLKIDTELIERWDITDPKEFIRDIEWIDKSISGSVFKRIQSPPIVITSQSAYGYDIRESMLPYRRSQKYEELKQKILKMDRYSSNKQHNGSIGKN